jgi:hypothetical protein
MVQRRISRFLASTADKAAETGRIPPDVIRRE